MVDLPILASVMLLVVEARWKCSYARVNHLSLILVWKFGVEKVPFWSRLQMAFSFCLVLAS